MCPVQAHTIPYPHTRSRATRVAVALLTSLGWALAHPGARAEDLPSPDAMWVGGRIVPRTIVEGFRGGIVDATLDAALAGRTPADRAALRARAAAGMKPVLDEAFPPELLAGLGASFVSARYTAEEIRALRAREESPLGQKLRAFEKAALEVKGDTPEERDRAREALSRRTFSAAERAELEAFAATPLGKKGIALAPDLVAFFVDQLDRRWAAVRTGYEPQLRRVADGLVQKAR